MHKHYSETVNRKLLLFCAKKCDGKEGFIQEVL